ncbi:MAG: MFS transporter [Hyphomicrobiales bacterium]|nr:MFS transporter [Hyphomicrobiales bacterium]
MDAAATTHEHHGFMTLLAHLREDRRYLAMIGLGFASGVPFQLVYATQSAWLSEAGVPLHVIGMLVELTIAYKFKWLWAPFLDRYDPPILANWLGRRRAWIVVSQIFCMIALAGVAFGDPGHFLAWTIAFSVALGVAGATQDITIDGWRINAAPPGKQSVMTAFAEVGYRFGALASGAGALMIAQHFGWRVAYLVMAALLLVGAASAFLGPEPELDKLHHGEKTHPGFVDTVWTPIKDLITRLGPLAFPILILIAGFRMPGYLTSAMAMPLFKSLHLSNDEIALVTKSFGFGIALLATFFSAYIVQKIGVMKSLLIGTAAGSASHLALAWLAGHGNEFWAFCLAVGIEGFAYNFAQMVLIIFMSLIVSKEYAASQFALLTSLVALPGSVLAGFSGFIVERVGFVHFFIGTSLIGIPVALLAWWVWRQHGSAHWTQPGAETVDAAGAAGH